MFNRENIYNNRLMCFIISLEYDFCIHTGYLRLRNGDCCDMKSCLNLFKAIDPEVVEIITFSGNKPDTQYHKKHGLWTATTEQTEETQTEEEVGR